MRYHTQEHLWNTNDEIPKGSCYPTILACILDLELHDVPYFHLLYFKTQIEHDNIKKYFSQKFLNNISREEYIKINGDNYNIENYDNHLFSMLYWLWENVRETWLASKGYKETYISKKNIEEWIKKNPFTPYIVTGTSARGVLHVVIYQNGKMIHDPHPNRTGVFETPENEFRYSFLEKI